MKKAMKTAGAVVLLLILVFSARTALAYTGNGGTTVYVTRTGNCYHRSGCKYLKSSRAIALEDAYIDGYLPCEICQPPQYTGTAKRGEVRTKSESSKTSTRQTKTETATESTSKTDWKEIIGATLAVGGVMFFWFGIPTIVKRAEKRKGK